MIQIISTCAWRDLSDRHLYREGDPFPFDGREIPEERLQALLSGQNMAGLAVIRAVELPDEPQRGSQQQAPEGAVEAEKPAPAKEPEQQTAEAQAQPQKKTTAKRSRKKN